MIPEGTSRDELLDQEHDRLYRAQRRLQAEAAMLRVAAQDAMGAAFRLLDKAKCVDGAVTEVVERRVQLWLERQARRGALR